MNNLRWGNTSSKSESNNLFISNIYKAILNITLLSSNKKESQTSNSPPNSLFWKLGYFFKTSEIIHHRSSKWTEQQIPQPLCLCLAIEPYQPLRLVIFVLSVTCYMIDGEDEGDKSPVTPARKREIEQRVEKNSQIVSELERGENVLRIRLQRMEEERLKMTAKVSPIHVLWSLPSWREWVRISSIRSILSKTPAWFWTIVYQRILLCERNSMKSPGSTPRRSKMLRNIGGYNHLVTNWQLLRSRVLQLESQLTVSESTRKRLEETLSDLKRDSMTLKRTLDETSEQVHSSSLISHFSRLRTNPEELPEPKKKSLGYNERWVTSANRFFFSIPSEIC